MADQRRQAGVSRRYFSFRGVHASGGDVSLGETGLYAVVYVFRVEKYEQRADGVFCGADADRRARVFPRQCVAEYTGHLECVFAEWWARGVYVAIDSGGYAGSELRDLWPGL